MNCSRTRKDCANTLRQADHILIEELRKHGLYDKVSQVFAVCLPMTSVGVTGDGIDLWRDHPARGRHCARSAAISRIVRNGYEIAALCAQ